jgi:hypothetical protein
MYRVYPPPYTKEASFTMRVPPPNYKDMGWEGEGSAFESAQVIGGMPPTDVEGIDLGFVKVNIRNVGGEPKIEYVHDEDANVGERSKTVGYGKGQIPVEAWWEAKARGVKYADFVEQYSGEKVNGAIETSKSLPLNETDESARAAREILAEKAALDLEMAKQQNQRNQKPWWEDEFYEALPESNVRQHFPSYRYYRGKRLLPINLETKL